MLSCGGLYSAGTLVNCNALPTAGFTDASDSDSTSMKHHSFRLKRAQLIRSKTKLTILNLDFNIYNLHVRLNIDLIKNIISK